MIAHVIMDNDGDGLASAVLMEKYLKHLGYDVILRFSPTRIMENDFKRIRASGADLYVFLDVSSTFSPLVNKYLSDKKVWFIDHHPRYEEPLPDVEMYENPTEKGVPDYVISTSFIVFNILKSAKIATPEDAVIALMGMIGDFTDHTISRNRFFERIMKYAGKSKYSKIKVGWVARGKGNRKMYDIIVDNYLPAANPDQVKSFREMLMKEVYTGSKFQKEVIKTVYYKKEKPVRKTLFYKGHEIHDIERWMRDSTGTDGKIRKLEFLKAGFVPANLKYSNYSINAVSIREKLKNVKSYGKFFFYYEKTFGKVTIPLSYMSSWYIRDKPVIGINCSDKWVYVHGRMNRYSTTEIDIGKVMYDLSKELGGYGGGHKYAGSAKIPLVPIEKVLKKLYEIM